MGRFGYDAARRDARTGHVPARARLVSLGDPHAYAIKQSFEPRDHADDGFISRVHVAYDLAGERPVALKEITLLPGSDRGRLIRLFAREASALRRASRCRNLPRLHAFRVLPGEGTVWIAMDYIRGQTVDDMFIQSDGVPPGRDGIRHALAIAIDVCRALRALHGRDIAHRDVTAENIVVDRTRAVLVDLGLGVTPRADVIGSREGTPTYRATEQTSKQRATFDLPGPATDVRGLGAVLYHLLTATALPISPAPDEPVAVPRARNPAIPVDLSALVMEMLATDPRKRPSARRVQRRLEDIHHRLRDLTIQTGRRPDAVGLAPPASPGAARSRLADGRNGHGHDLNLRAMYNDGAPPAPAPRPCLPPLVECGASPPSVEERRRARFSLYAAGVIAAILIAAATLMLLWPGHLPILHG